MFFLFMKEICEKKSAVCSNDHMSQVYTTSYPEIISLLPWALKGNTGDLLALAL